MTAALGIISRLFTLAGIIALLGIYWSDVHADEPPNVTMTVMESEEMNEESLVSEIRLPDREALRAQERKAQRSETGVRAGEGGMQRSETAEQARERGREFGQERAAEARERGREAREAAGNEPGRGLRDRPDNTPGRPDDAPGRPDNVPGRPDTPPGRDESPPGRPDTPPGRED
jgi:hypothetical protein